jgi:hypothetical protein
MANFGARDTGICGETVPAATKVALIPGDNLVRPNMLRARHRAS